MWNHTGERGAIRRPTDARQSSGCHAFSCSTTIVGDGKKGVTMNRFTTQTVTVLVARETLGRRGGGDRNIAYVDANNQSAVLNLGLGNVGFSGAGQAIIVIQG
jgi:hypothetical protein